MTHDQDEALSLADRIVVMKDGVAQQVGTPQQVYGQPANLAVARFMGYRNELNLEIAAQHNSRIDLKGQGIAISGVAQGTVGASIVAAMRPDDFTVVANGAAAGNILTAPVESIEYYGRETLFMLRLVGQSPLFVRAQGNARVGDLMTVSIPPERVLVYPSDRAA